MEIWDFPRWKREDPPTDTALQDINREGKKQDL